MLKGQELYNNFSNQRWSMDFMVDTLADGRRFRVLTVMDEFSRECLAIDTAVSIPGIRVTRVLDAIAAQRGTVYEALRGE